jgi:regulator of protease activity HflC (stomatin/prohibitin superfamily)
MLIRYFKGEPNDHVMVYRHGRVVREGRGISFFYTPHNTSLVVVPVTALEEQFVVHETTKDYQDLSLQGYVSYRVLDPQRTAEVLNFAYDPRVGDWKEPSAPGQITIRIESALQALAAPVIRNMTLEEGLAAGERIAATVGEQLREDPSLKALGVRVESLYVFHVRATPEMKQALEADLRENLNRRADQAIYARRAAALEEERTLKHTELATDREIEEGRRELVATQADNKIKAAEADAKAEEMRLAPYTAMDSRILTGLALKAWAENGQPVGQLNITPDMLTHLAGWMGRGHSDSEAA